MNATELSVLARAPETAPRVPSPEFLRAARRVRQLSWLSLVWMGAEGAIAIAAGVLAGSIALVGFGIDSAIEGFASGIIVWRFTGSRMLSSSAEERAQKLVAIQFFLLAPYVAFEAVSALIAGERPETSWLGIALTISSVIGMPLLGVAKVRLAEQLGGHAGRGQPEPPVRLPRGCRSHRPPRQHAARGVVARPGCRARDRRRRGSRGSRDVARRGVLRAVDLAGGRAQRRVLQVRGRRSGLLLATGAVVLAALVLPAGAAAHGIQLKKDLPIPEWLFGWAAAMVLVASFVALATLWPKPRLEGDEPWRPLPRPLQLLTSRGVEIACGAVGVFLLVLTIYSGVAGNQSVGENFAPTFVYVIFWVGLVPLSVLFGDVFRAFNPWRAVGRAVSWMASRVGDGESSAFDYPDRLGRWPAVAGIVAFAVMELVVDTGTDPRPIAVAAVMYSGVTWFCMAVYGVERWCDRGEAFSVYFGLLARLSVFERRGDVLGRRRFLSGLARLDVLPGTVPLLAAVIGSTSFDGFSESPVWGDDIGRTLHELAETLGASSETAGQLASGVGLVLMILLVLGFYLLGVRGARTVGGPFDTRGLARAFVHSLVPIGLAYVLAHYASLLLFQGQAIAARASDPLGEGSDLFGTAEWGVDLNWIGAETLWYMQIGFVVAGHVAALVLAHDRALVLYSEARMAVRSQYWMLIVMVGFTSFALWLLSEAAA